LAVVAVVAIKLPRSKDGSSGLNRRFLNLWARRGWWRVLRFRLGKRSWWRLRVQ
jgi:hypothetical protein